ncbi:MAG: hypothetical protein R3B07_34580 [Polyangiaceae bacterium]
MAQHPRASGAPTRGDRDFDGLLEEGPCSIVWCNADGRARGRPWSSDGGATPGHVASVAKSKGQADVAEWAAEIERAAYGPIAPDADAEQRIGEQQPGRAEAD